MKVSKSGLFLFELIVVIFLFTVASSVCAVIFAKSYNFSTESEALTMSAVKSESIAEIFKKGDGDAGSDANMIASVLGIDDASKDVNIQKTADNYGELAMNLYYDENWQSTDESHKTYTITIKANTAKSGEANDIISANITTNRSDDNVDGDIEIFSITASKIANNK